MSTPSDRKSLDVAIELGFLTETQLNSINEKSGDSGLSEIEIAIRQGFLNRQHLEVLAAFGSPEEVAPGYRIDGLIGQGGAGVVYMATQIGLNRSVALKTINQNNVRKNELAPRRFEREAQIVGQLRHPNIVSAFDFGTHNDRLFLVMEFVDGIDAEKHLSRQGSIPEGHAWHIALQVSHALSYANELGIIHRDIKPGNLILTSSPKGASVPSQVPFVKIADFGLARFKEQPVEANITMDASVSGTPFYMSPEQISAKELDHRSDIYGLGTTIWHLMTGKPPITGDNPLDIIYNRIQVEDGWLDEKPEEISPEGMELLREMCRFHLDERISDYSSLTEKIENILENFDLAALDSVHPNFVAGTEPQKFAASTDITFIDASKGVSTKDGAWRKSETQQNKSGRGNSKSTADLVGAPVRSKYLLFGLGAASLIAAFLLIFFNMPNGNSASFGKSASGNSEPVRPVHSLKLGGPPIFLFDGLEIPTKQRASGTWEVASGSEKEKVLSGHGTRNFKCVDPERVPLKHFRFDCGFRHNKAEMIEFRWLDNDQVIFHVSISPEMATLYDGESEIGSCELQKSEGESYGYHHIQIESLPGHWSIALEPNLIGVISKANIPIDATRGTPIIQLAVEGTGDAHFEQIRFRRYLMPEKQTPEKQNTPDQ